MPRLPQAETLFRDELLSIAQCIDAEDIPRLTRLLTSIPKYRLNAYGIEDATVLHYAAHSVLRRFSNHWDLLTVLIQHGADPLKKAPFFNNESVVSFALNQLYKDSSPSSTLCLEALLKGGLPPDAYTDHESKTPILFRTVGHIPPHALNLLLTYGVDLERRDYYGRTALMESLSDTSLEALYILLQHGADTTVVDSRGRSFAWQLYEQLKLHHSPKTKQALVNLKYNMIRLGNTWPPNDGRLSRQIPWCLKN